MFKSSNPALTAFNDLMVHINSGNERAVKQVLAGQHVQKIINGDPRKGLDNGIPLLHALHPKSGAVNVAIVIALLSIQTINVNLDLKKATIPLVELLAAVNLTATETDKINSLLQAHGSKKTLPPVAPAPSATLPPTTVPAPSENPEDDDYVVINSSPPGALPGDTLTSQQSVTPPTWSEWLGLTKPSTSLSGQQ